MRALSITEAAYTAGLIDGEGCISYYGIKSGSIDRLNYSTRIKVAMTDPRPIYWLADILGCGFITTRERKAPYRRVFEWQTKSKVDIVAILAALLPFLIVKKDQAELLLNFLQSEVRIPGRTKRPELVALRQVQIIARNQLAKRLKELKVPPTFA